MTKPLTIEAIRERLDAGSVGPSYYVKDGKAAKWNVRDDINFLLADNERLDMWRTALVKSYERQLAAANKRIAELEAER